MAAPPFAPPFTGPRAALTVLLLAPALALSSCGGSSGSSPRGASATSPTRSQPSSPPAGSAPPAGGATGSAGTGHVASAAAGGVEATLRAGTHTPRVGVPWPVRFTVTRGGGPARASVEYEFMLGNTVVAHRSHYRFTGRFSDTIVWPSSAVGYPLTLRAVIVSGNSTINLDYPVQVQR